MRPDLLCPLCTARLELVTDGMIVEPLIPSARFTDDGRTFYRWRSAPFLACTGCEFCAEVETRDGQIVAVISDEGAKTPCR